MAKGRSSCPPLWGKERLPKQEGSACGQGKAKTAIRPMGTGIVECPKGQAQQEQCEACSVPGKNYFIWPFH